jgi:hypothetical protein
MEILTYETFLLDVLFKKKLRPRKDDLKFPRGHMNFRGVIDPRKFRINLHKLLRGNF